MRTLPPQLPSSSPEPPDKFLLPPFPDLPAPGLAVPGQPVPALPARLPLPAAGPAFDDQGAAGGPASAAAGPGPAPQLAPGAAGRAGAGREARAAPQPAAEEPGAGPWASVFARALAEALAGARPSRQIAPWTTEQARRRIQQLGPLLQDGPRPVVRRVLTCTPSPDVVEMTVIVGIGPRTRAIAVRLERARASTARPDRGRRWVCTVIEAA
jgi:Family of unknown function (DUF6459)